MKRLKSEHIVLPAASVAAAVVAALAIRQRRARTRLERLGGAALETLLNAIDANDPATGAHARRVARFALVLADSVGLDEHMCRSVERVALFHDIGKIHQALFDITHDDEKLVPSERRSIRTHPDRGAKVLEPLSAFYPDLPEGVVSHHERWDGKGYPRRLKGLQIPLTARIVAIADTFDAITHSRRYRPGRSVQVGVQILGEGRGSQFDPALVDLFMSPPVIKRVGAEMHQARSVERGVTRRSERGADAVAPDVSFRWRATAPAQRTPDRPSRTRH